MDDRRGLSCETVEIRQLMLHKKAFGFAEFTVTCQRMNVDVNCLAFSTDDQADAEDFDITAIAVH